MGGVFKSAKYTLQVPGHTLIIHFFSFLLLAHQLHKLLFLLGMHLAQRSRPHLDFYCVHVLIGVKVPEATILRAATIELKKGVYQ